MIGTIIQNIFFKNIKCADNVVNMGLGVAIGAAAINNGFPKNNKPKKNNSKISDLETLEQESQSVTFINRDQINSSFIKLYESLNEEITKKIKLEKNPNIEDFNRIEDFHRFFRIFKNMKDKIAKQSDGVDENNKQLQEQIQKIDKLLDDSSNWFLTVAYKDIYFPIIRSSQQNFMQQNDQLIQQISKIFNTQEASFQDPSFTDGKELMATIDTEYNIIFKDGTEQQICKFSAQDLSEIQEFKKQNSENKMVEIVFKKLTDLQKLEDKSSQKQIFIKIYKNFIVLPTGIGLLVFKIDNMENMNEILKGNIEKYLKENEDKDKNDASVIEEQEEDHINEQEEDYEDVGDEDENEQSVNENEQSVNENEQSVNENEQNKLEDFKAEISNDENSNKGEKNDQEENVSQNSDDTEKF